MKHKVALRQEKVKLWGHKAKEPLTQKLKLATGLKKVKNSSRTNTCYEDCQHKGNIPLYKDILY